MTSLLLYISSGLILAWGISHIFPTPAVVKGFEPLTPDNRRIITMEWVAEGLTLVFIGLLVGLVEWLYGLNPVSVFVFRFCAGMLFVMALWTLLTGAQTSILPIKICPLVKTICAALIFLATVL